MIYSVLVVAVMIGIGGCWGASGQVAIVLEGLDVGTADQTLQTLRSTCPPTKVLLAVTTCDLKDELYAQKVRMAITEGHKIAIRYNSRCTNCNIKDLGKEKACRCLTKMSSSFLNAIGVQPRYVLFPYTVNPETIAFLKDVAQCAGEMQMISYTFDLESAMLDPYRKCDLDKREVLGEGLVLIYGFHRDGGVPFEEKLRILQEMTRFSGLSLTSFDASMINLATRFTFYSENVRDKSKRLFPRDFQLSARDIQYLEGEESSEDGESKYPKADESQVKLMVENSSRLVTYSSWPHYLTALIVGITSSFYF
jgi:hypothetical protein